MDMTDGRSLFSKWGNLIPQAPRTSLSKDQTETEAVMRRWEEVVDGLQGCCRVASFFNHFSFSLTFP